jgi:perosamine synthetase
MGAVAPGMGEDDGLLVPCANRGDEVRSWFVFCVQLPAEADRDQVIALLGKRGIQSRAYLPCIHTMPPYRERFGFQGGEFPVAERVASRSLALPFFGSMTMDQVDRVCSELGAALDGR